MRGNGFMLRSYAQLGRTSGLTSPKLEVVKLNEMATVTVLLREQFLLDCPTAFLAFRCFHQNGEPSPGRLHAKAMRLR